MSDTSRYPNICEGLPSQLAFPITVDRVGEVTGRLPLGGWAVSDEYCDEAVIETASISIPITVTTSGPSTYKYTVTALIGGSPVSIVWTGAGTPETTNAAGTYSGSQSGTITANIPIIGQSPSALSSFGIEIVVAADSAVEVGEPVLDITLDNSSCDTGELECTMGNVSICLPTVGIYTSCSSTATTDVQALPVAPQGIMKVEVCEKCEPEWETVILCASIGLSGQGVGGRDILAGEQIITNLLRDCEEAGGGILSVRYFDPQDPTFELDEFEVAVEACPGATSFSIEDGGCVRDADGIDWLIKQAVDGAGEIVSPPGSWYVQEDGTTGVPSGDPSEWTECCDSVCIDLSRYEYQCRGEAPPSTDPVTISVTPFAAETRVFDTSDISPQAIEDDLGTADDPSSLVDGSGSWAPTNPAVQNLIARFNILEGQPECVSVSGLRAYVRGEPGGGGYFIHAWDGSDPSSDIIPTTLPATESAYQQYNANSSILYNGYNFDAGLPIPQAPSGIYEIEIPINAGAVSSTDLQNFTLGLGVINNTDIIHGLRVEADLVFDNCDGEAGSEPTNTLQVVIPTECQNQLGDLNVNVTNECITVKVQEAQTTDLVSTSEICYPDPSGGNIVLEQITVIQQPDNIVVNQYYVVVLPGASGLASGDLFTPADPLLLQECPNGASPILDSTDICYEATEAGTGWAVGDRIVCKETYDVTAGGIGSGNEILLYTTYTLESSGQVVTGFDPQSQGTICIPEGNFDVERTEVCVNSIELDGQTWIVGPICNGGPVYYSTTTDQAILDEQTIVGGWAIVIASEISNCGVEAAQILGNPSVDPTTVAISQCKISQHTVYDATTGEIDRTYYTNQEGNIVFVDVVIVKCQESCCPSVQEHYVCVSGQKIQAFVSVDPMTLMPIKTVNAITFEEILNPSFVEVCGDCCETDPVTCAMFRQDYYNLADFIGDAVFPLTWLITGTDGCIEPINLSVTTPLDAGWTDNANIYDDLIAALNTITGVQAVAVNTIGYNGDGAPEIEISIASGVSVTINRTYVAENDMFTISESGGTTTVTAIDTNGFIGSDIWHECGTGVAIGNNNTFPNTL